MSEPKFIWRRYNDKWYIYGPRGHTNETVKVYKRNGIVEEKRLGNEVQDGSILYEVIQDGNTHQQENINRFKKQEDTWYVEINDGKEYKVGDKIEVITNNGASIYEILDISDNKCYVRR